MENGVCASIILILMMLVQKIRFLYPVLIVDEIASHQLLSFLEAYSGYNQIPMYPHDSTDKAFITPTRMCCYNVMPFGLKNAKATYQRMMSHIFEPMLGKTMEAFSALARGVLVDKKAPITVELG